MGFLDDAEAKVSGLLEGHEDQVKEGIDKAADAAEAKFGSEHSAQIDGVADKAKDAIDKLGQ
jgi:hypothetical protein